MEICLKYQEICPADQTVQLSLTKLKYNQVRSTKNNMYRATYRVSLSYIVDRKFIVILFVRGQS